MRKPEKSAQSVKERVALQQVTAGELSATPAAAILDRSRRLFI